MALGNAWLSGASFPPPTIITPDFFDGAVVYDPVVVLPTFITPDYFDPAAIYDPTLLLGTPITPEFFDAAEVYEPALGTPISSFLVERGPLVKDWGDWTPATKQDVHVYVDSVEVEVADVNPYHGEIFLVVPIVPSPTVTVTVDYKWIRHPIMGMLLNTEGLGLNKSDHRKGNGQFYGPGGTITGHGSQIQEPGFPKGALRTHSRFMFRAVIQGPPAPSARPAPVLLGHRYIGFEKAYTAALNCPTTMRLNNPPHLVAKRGFKRSVEGISEWFEGTETPEASTPSWALEGYDAGYVNLNQGTYTLVDDRTGSFDPENPDVTLYWRSVDLTYPASSYIVGRFLIEDADALFDDTNTNILSPDGVFTGVGFGIHNNLRFWLAGALLINGLEHVGLLLDSRRPEKVESWRVGPYSTVTILSTTSMSVLTGQAPLSLVDGDRFQILTGTQAGVYTADHVVVQSNGTTTVTVSPAFPADFTKYGNQYPEVVWESPWSENPATYRLEVAPEQNLAVLRVSGDTTGTVAYMNDTAPLLAEGDLIGQTAVTNLLAGTTLGVGDGRVEYLAVPHGQAGNGIVVSQVDPGVEQESTTVDVVGTTITVNLSREADIPAKKATLALGAGSATLHLQADTAGATGNSIRIELVDPGAPLSPLSVSVASQDITVNLETDVGSTVISTAAEVAQALNADATAKLLVDAVGSIGVVVPVAFTSLVGGEDLVPGALTATAHDVVDAINASSAATALVDAYAPVRGPAQVDSRMLSGGRGVTTEGSGQVFWGSLSAKATSRSKWSFFRYGIVPDYSTLRSSSQTVAAEMGILPTSETYNPWFVTQQFGYSTANGQLLLKSTSNHPTLNFSYGYDRVEPFMLPHAFLDAQAKLQVDSGVVGSGDAQIVLRDTQREVRVSALLYMEGFSGINWRRLITLPSVSYAGLLSPSKLGWVTPSIPIPSTASPATVENIGPVLNINQGSEEWALYEKPIEIPSGVTIADGRIFEARLAVLSYSGGPTSIEFGARPQSRPVRVRLWGGGTPGVQLLDIADTVVQTYPFDWTDGLPHTYRVVADAVGNTVTLFIDDVVQAPTLLLSTFPTALPGSYSDCLFGVRPVGSGITSETEWYSVSCHAMPLATAKRTLGVWKGGDPDDINNWEIPRTDSSDTPNSRQIGPVIEEMDWRDPIELRVFKTPQWGVTVYRPDLPPPPYYSPEVYGVPGTGFATQTTEPSAGWINVETADLPRVSSIFGSVAFGALDPLALTQQRWDWMRYRLYRPASPDHIAPQGMVLNRANVVTSGEIYKDITLEEVIVKVASPTTVSLIPAHQRAQDIYKIMDGSTPYVRDSWTFDKSTQTVTLNDGLEFINPTVTVIFNPGRPVTSTYLRNQPVLDGITQLNEGTPPVPKSQTLEASHAEQLRDYPTEVPDRYILPAYSPNDPKGIPDSAAFQAADTNDFADFMTSTAAHYQKMTFIEVEGNSETGLIKTVSDAERPPTGRPGEIPPEITVEGFVLDFFDAAEVYEPLVCIQGPISGDIEGDSEVTGFLTAPGPVSGDIEGDSTVAGTLIGVVGMSASIIGDSVVGGTLAGEGALAGPILGDSDVGGALTGIGALAGALSLGDAIVSGTLTDWGKAPISGSIIGDASVTGFLTAPGTLAGPLVGDSTVVGTVGGIGTLSGPVVGDSTIAGALVGEGALSGLILGDSTVAGTLISPADLAGAIVGDSAVAGTLAATGAIAGALVGDSVVAGVMAGDGALAGPIIGDSTVGGTLVGDGALAGSTTGDSTIGGFLTAPGSISGPIVGDSTVSGTVTGDGALAGPVVGDSTVAGTLVGDGALAGPIVGDSTTTGTATDAPPQAFAEINFSGATAPTTITVGSTAYKAQGTTSIPTKINFTDGAVSNRAVYTGTPTRDFLVTVTAALGLTTGTGTRGGIFLYKNGAALAPDVLMETQLGPLIGYPGEATLTAIVSLSTNDYLELWVTSIVGGDTVTVHSGGFTVVSIS